MRGRLSVAIVILAASACVAGAQTYDDALARVRQGAFTDAIVMLQPLAASMPPDVRVLNLMGAALSSIGRREEGNVQFLRALAARPGFLPALKNLALNELALGQFAKSRSHFEEVVKQAPAEPSAQLGLAQLDYADKRFAQALEHYERSNGLYLKDAAALSAYAATCIELKHPARALDAIAQLPDFEGGLMLARMGRYTEAAQRFEKARKDAADLYQVEFNLTLAYLKSDNNAAAIETARGMRATSEVSSLLAHAYEASGRTVEAYDVLRQAILRDPRGESLYLELMALCAEHENYDLSLQIAGTALEQMPDSYRLHSQRGIVLAMMGKFDESERDLLKASELSPADNMAPVARSLVLMRTNRVADALRELRARRRADGGDYLVNWFLGEALTREGTGGEEAVESLRRSVELNGEVPQSRALLGKLLLARGETDAAIAQLERSLELDGNGVTAMYQLAQAYRKKGNAARASELFARVAKTKAQEGDTLTRDGMMRIVRDHAR